MRYILALATVAVVGVAGAAFANDQMRDQAPEQAISADQLKSKIETMGYDVDRMKTDGDVYRARLVDRDTGRTVKASFDAESGELEHAKLAQKEREESHEGRQAGEHKERHEDRDDRREDRH